MHSKPTDNKSLVLSVYYQNNRSNVDKRFTPSYSTEVSTQCA